MASKEYDAAINRAYYAAFEAAHAALTAHGVVTPKTHRGLDSLFQKHLVKIGLFSSNLGGYLTKLAAKRITSDYEEEYIDEHTAQEAVDMAEKFINAIEPELEQLIVNKTDATQNKIYDNSEPK